MNRLIWLVVGFVILLFGFSLFVAACGDDDDDSAGDDDDDSTQDTHPPDVRDTTELDDTLDEAGPYVVQTTATDDVGVDSVNLYYRVGAGELKQVSMDLTKSTHQGQIPGQIGGSLISYYVEAADAAGNSATDPPDAPTTLFGFDVLKAVDESMQTDDGSAEVGWNIAPGTEGAMLAKVLTPSGYPSFLTEVSVQLEQSCNGIFDFEVHVYKDASGGDPGDATLVWSSGSQTEGMQENYTFEWFAYDVAGSLADTPLSGGTWVIGVMNHSGQMYLGGDTDFPTPDPNGWIYYRGAGQWETMSDYALSWVGTFMVRAKGYFIDI